MKTRRPGFFFTLLLVTAAAVLFLGGSALALDLRVTNEFDKKMYFALVYHDSDSGKWRTRGWFSVEPRKTRTVSLKTSKSKVYIHSQVGNNTWGKGDISRTVINESFSYLDGQKCPAGKNRKSVKFSEYQANSKGIIAYRPVLASNAKKPSGTQATTAAQSQKQAALEIVRLTNIERRKEKHTELKTDEALMKAAQKRAMECAVSYSHTRPDGRDYDTVLEEYKVAERWSAGENIAYDNINVSASRAVNGWMNSPGHRANILNSDCSHIGVGVYSKNGKNYYVQLFMLKKLK